MAGRDLECLLRSVSLEDHQPYQRTVTAASDDQSGESLSLDLLHLHESQAVTIMGMAFPWMEAKVLPLACGACSGSAVPAF